MDISILLIRFLFLALPGIISNRLFKSLIGGATKKDWEDLVEILIFSVINYSLLGWAIELLQNYGYPLQSLTFIQAAIDDKTPIVWQEIVFASLIGVVIGLLAAYVERFNLINKIGLFIGASTKYGYGDVWNNFNLNFSEKWVFVRDHKVDLAYYGAIFVYSDVRNSKERELILKEVDVYSNVSGEFLYKCDVIYLSRSYDDLTIEVPVTKDDIQEPQKVVTKKGDKK